MTELTGRLHQLTPDQLERMILVEMLREALQQAGPVTPPDEPKAASITGWRLPKPGDKVRVIATPELLGFYPTSPVSIGDTLTVQSVGCGATKSTAPYEIDWAVMVVKNDEVASFAMPLPCLEPVN